MGLSWRFKAQLEASGLAPEAFAERAGIEIGADWLGPVPPAGMRMEELERICEALGLQPGELLAWEAETPGAIAQRTLAADQFYQSLLAHRQSQAEEAGD